MPRFVFALFFFVAVNLLLCAVADEGVKHTNEDLKALLQDSFHAGVRDRHRLASLSRSKMAHTRQMLGTSSSIKNVPFKPLGIKLNRVAVDTPLNSAPPLNFANTLRKQFSEQDETWEH